MNSRTLRIPFAFLQWLLVLYAVVACNKGKPAFEQFGEMRTVMSESQTHASVFLCAAYSAPYANSVGALADLDGEVTIADGQVWVTPNVGDKPVTSRPLCADGDRAILLSVGHMSSSIRFALAASADIHAPERAIHDASENCIRHARDGRWFLCGRSGWCAHASLNKRSYAFQFSARWRDCYRAH